MPMDFTDKKTAQAWDSDTTFYNPTRPQQLDLMLTIIEDAYQPGDTILDLGFGSGLVEERIFRRIPGASGGWRGFIRRHDELGRGTVDALCRSLSRHRTRPPGIGLPPAGKGHIPLHHQRPGASSSD